MLGGAGAGKTRHILHTFLKYNSSANLSSLLLLPNTSQVTHSKELLIAESGNTGFFDENILTFSTLSAAVISSSVFARPISRTGQELIVSGLVQSGEYKYLEPVINTRGFRTSFLYTVQQMKSQGIMPRQFNSLFTLNQSKNTANTAQNKWIELGKLYQAYQTHLRKEKLIDSEDVLQLAFQKLENHADIYGTIKCLLVDGFHDYSVLERKILESLIKRIPDVTVTLLYNPENKAPGLWDACLSAYTWLKGIGLEEKKLSSNLRTAKSGLQHISSGLFSPVQLSEPAGDEIQWFSADSRSNEVETIVREIAFMVRKGQYDFKDCVVILRRIEPYYRLLEEHFSLYGIPYRIYTSRNIRNYKSARMVVALLSMVLSGWKQDSTLGFLRFTGSAEHYSEIDLISIEAGRRKNIRGFDSWLTLLESGNYPWILGQLEKVKKWDEAGKNIKKIKDLCTHIKAFLNRIFEDEFAAVVGQSSMAHNSRENNLAIQHLFGILDELALYYTDRNGISFYRVLESFKEHILSGSFRAVHRRQNVVNIIDVLESRQWEKKVVFVAGLAEKEFPSLGESNFFWSERERLDCIRNKNVYLPGMREKFVEEQFLFYVALTRARERLYVSFPMRDDNGAELRPSFFLRNLGKLFGKETDDLYNSRLSSFYVMPEGTRFMVPADLRKLLYSAMQNSEWQDTPGIPLKALGSTLIRKPHIVQQLQQYLFPYDVTLGAEPILKILANPNREYSATRLETFAVCPYRHFASHILAVESPSEIERKSLTPLDEGCIVHKVIELYYKSQKKARIEDIFNTQYKSYVTRFDLSIDDDKKKRNMLVCLRAFERSENEHPISPFIPTHFEVEYGSKQSRPVRITGEHGREILLRGKIDRIDVPSNEKDGIGIVIDYKYSKRNFTKKNLIEIREGISLQLPFYLLSIEQIYNLKPAAGIIFSLAAMKFGGIVDQESAVSGSHAKLLSEIDLQKINMKELLEQSSRYIINYVEAIQQGVICLQTDDPGKCGIQNCDYVDICRSQLHKMINPKE